ncbi:MAG TPA: hypothetical protein VHT05_00390 [Candidatus Elarobacter sp.]|nr:hypothetical protein [Candidatus Elarobacter sp.]
MAVGRWFGMAIVRHRAGWIALAVCATLYGCGASTASVPAPVVGAPTLAAAGSTRVMQATSTASPSPASSYASLPADGSYHTYTFALRPQDFGDPATSAPGTAYAHPITVTLTETGDSGHATLLFEGATVSKATVSSSGQTVALRYDGQGSVGYTTLTTFTATGFASDSVRVSPLFVEPFDVYWPSSDNPHVPLVNPAAGLSAYLTAFEVDAPASVKYTAKATSGCAGVATVSISGVTTTVTGGPHPALAGPCSVVISDGSSSVTTPVENRIAGPDRTGVALLTTYWPSDITIGPQFASDISSYVLGPQGAIYFWEDAGNPAKIGRITMDGSIIELATPSGIGGWAIAAGADGNLWTTNVIAHSVERVTLQGVFTVFPIPAPADFPDAITAGPDGNLWLTTEQPDVLCRITTAGAFTEFSLPNGYPFSGYITAGPDGNLWFGTASAIGRSTPNGTITMFPITPNAYPDGITTGPDGNIWFTEHSANAIGRITPAGTVTEFPLPRPDSRPESILTGPDGNLVFTLEAGNAIDEISTSGAITEYAIPNIVSNGILVKGSDGNLWIGNGTSIQKLQVSR